MYELVNTSAPNGLIPGTHGFATVAMTKGIPDAIRTRVENFCAYPHRTSSHDQSYWTENPVNWFHLTLPGGDHVVGRTAPSDFDYTGRTNRISRVLYFKAKEMPQIGGVRVLAAEAERLSGNWEGEPRCLAEDKATAGRLMMAAPPANVMPSNWVKMFGSQGESLARRFAVLLANNVRGANRGIYFKASATDTDGTRLLGLFSDLIDLLPVELRPHVTFSTFAPCVPSGTVCHLRGIYDSDAAFAAASALQPWVDCGSCEVKHSELLPQEIVPDKARGDVGGTQKAFDGRDQSIARCKDAYRPAVIAGLKARTEATRKPSLGWGLTLVGAAVVVILSLACVVVKCIPLGGQNRQEAENGHVSPSADEIRKVDLWNENHSKTVGRFKQKVDECTSTNGCMQLKEQIQKAMEGLEDSLRDSLGGKECGDFESDLNDVRNKYKGLLSRLLSKNQDLAKQAEEEPRAKVELEVKKSLGMDADIEDPVRNATVKEQEKKKDNKAMAVRDVSLKDLPSMEIVPFGKKWDTNLANEDKERLRETNSLYIFYLSDGEYKRTSSRFDKKTTPNPMRRSKNVTWAVDFSSPESAFWTVVYVPSLKKTYWQWDKEIKLKLFAEQDEVNLAKVVFGDGDEARELYEKWQSRVVYAVSWEDEGPWCLFTTHERLPIGRLKPEKKDVMRLQGEIANLDEDIKALNKEIADLQAKTNIATAKWHPEMLKCLLEYNELKGKQKKSSQFTDKGKKGDDGSEKKKRREALEKLNLQALCCVTNFPDHKTDKTIDLSKMTEETCKGILDSYLKKVGKDINDKRDKRKNLDNQLDKKKAELGSVRGHWKDKFKTQAYCIDVIRKLPDELSSDEKNRIDREGWCIKRPTGVNGN